MTNPLYITSLRVHAPYESWLHTCRSLGLVFPLYCLTRLIWTDPCKDFHEQLLILADEILLCVSKLMDVFLNESRICKWYSTYVDVEASTDTQTVHQILRSILCFLQASFTTFFISWLTLECLKSMWRNFRPELQEIMSGK